MDKELVLFNKHSKIVHELEKNPDFVNENIYHDIVSSRYIRVNNKLAEKPYM